MTTVVNWGVLGTARIAEQQIVPAVTRSTNGRVLGVSSASGRARAFAERLGIPRAYTSHDALLADPEIDAVYLPLPNALHSQWTIRSAAAGKHVLCEKPIALTPDELTEMETVCRDVGVRLSEGFMYRHHPQIDRVRELLTDGRIGDVRAVEARFHFLMDITAATDIRLDQALGGGALRDVGCYPIDLMNLLLGGPPTEAAAVSSLRDGVGVETAIAAVLLYDGVIGTFSCGFESPAMDHCTILGSEGSIQLRHPFRPDANGGTGVIVVSAGSHSETIEVDGDSYQSEVEDFARRIVDNAPDTEGMRLSRWTVETTHRVAQAARLPATRLLPSSTTAPHR